MEKMTKILKFLCIAAVGFIIGIPAGISMCKDSNAAECWRLQQRADELQANLDEVKAHAAEDVKAANSRAAKSDAYKLALAQIAELANTPQ